MGVRHDIVGGAVDVEVLETPDEAVSEGGRPQRGWQPEIRVHVVHAPDVQAAHQVQLTRVTWRFKTRKKS